MSKRFPTMIKRARLPGMMTAATAVVALLVVAGSAGAQPRLLPFAQDESTDEPFTPVQRDQLFPAQRGISLEQARAIAQSRYPGQVVGARSVQMGDRLVYEFRILGDDGRVRTVRVDAQTGSIQ
jgi:uncharacterized membrane protein YkoI